MEPLVFVCQVLGVVSFFKKVLSVLLLTPFFPFALLFSPDPLPTTYRPPINHPRGSTPLKQWRNTSLHSFECLQYSQLTRVHSRPPLSVRVHAASS